MKKLTNKSEINPEQFEVLKYFENIINEPIPVVDEIMWHSFGVKIEKNNIVGLALSNKGISSLSKSIMKLTSLEFLELSNNKLISLPREIWCITSLKELYLGENKLESLTIPTRDTQKRSLQILDLRRNQLMRLPKSIGNFTKLKILNLKDNPLIVLPESIGRDR